MKKIFFLLVFGLFAVSAFSQTVRTRSYFHNLYITGYKPTQTNYRDLWVSVFWPNEDTLALTQLVGVDGTLSTDATLSTASNRQISSTLALKTYIDAAVAGGVADGDKTDIDVTGGGTVWTVDTSVIKTINLNNDAVTGAKIAASTIDSTDIATGGIGNTDLASGIVTGSKIATGAVDATQLASTAVTPGSYTNTNLTVDADGRITAASSGSGGVSDGDKGDIDVTSSGATWTIDTSAVTWLKLSQAVKDSIALDATVASNGLTMDGDTVQLGGTINANTTVSTAFSKKLYFGNLTAYDTYEAGQKAALFYDPNGNGIGSRNTSTSYYSLSENYGNSVQHGTYNRYGSGTAFQYTVGTGSGTEATSYASHTRGSVARNYGSTAKLDTLVGYGFSTLNYKEGSNGYFYSGLGKAGLAGTWKGLHSDSTLSYAVGRRINSNSSDFRYIDVLLRDTTANAISFYDGAYKFNNAVMSTTSGDTTIMAWVGGNNPIYLDKTDFGGGGGSGTVSSGTTNTVAKYTGTTTVGNSSITDDGAVVTVDVSGQTALVATGGLHAGISARSDNASGNSHIFLENSADSDNSYRLSRSADGDLDLIRSSAYPYSTDTDTIFTYDEDANTFDFKVGSITNNGSALGGGSLSGTGLTNRLAIWNSSSVLGYENEFVVDSTNSRLAIGTSSTSPSAQLAVRKDGIGVTQDNTYGIVLANNTAATSGNQQMSPGLRWRGNGWKTNATAASQTVDFLADVLPVQGAANPSGTWQLMASINAGAYFNILRAKTDGTFLLGASGNRPQLLLANGISSPIVDGTALQFVIDNTNGRTSTGFDFLISSNERAYTSGTVDVFRVTAPFSPTSGTGVFQNFRINPTINQTGGASGITRGIYVNPTLTSAADWRSIETSNTTGYSIYTSTAPNYFGGNTGIGTTSADRLFHVEASDAATNTVTYTTRNTHITSGTAAANFGSGTETELEDGAGNNEVALRSSTIWTDATNGSEDAHWMLENQKAGTLDTTLIMKSTGQLQLTEYGGGAFTGTPTYQLSADVNGNLIETAAPLNATATLDFPSTAINTCSELTITVTGAADGDVVALGTPNAVTVTGAVFTAWVSATNTVTVQYCNTSTVGAGNPASADFKIRVFK